MIKIPYTETLRAVYEDAKDLQAKGYNPNQATVNRIIASLEKFEEEDPSFNFKK